MTEASALDVEAVTFDFWNTLLVARPDDNMSRRVAAWHGLLEELGAARERAVVEDALAHSFAEYERSWHANEQFGAADCVRVGLEQLGLTAADVDVDRLTIATVDMGDEFDLTPNAASMLHALHDAGLSLGIVCDVGFTTSDRLRGHLDRHGVLGCFTHWSFSDEVGFYKPAPEIFDHALRGLGVADPGRSAHVGDLRRTDVAGARAHGMRTVRYAGVVDDRRDGPEADVVLTDHAALPARLGLA